MAMWVSMQGEARPGAAVGGVQAAGHGPLLARDAAGNAAPQGPRPDLPRERAAAVCGRLVTPVQRYRVLAPGVVTSREDLLRDRVGNPDHLFRMESGNGSGGYLGI